MLFNVEIFFLTLQKVIFLMCFIAAGYLLRRMGKLRHESAQTLSILTTVLFATSYNLTVLPKHFTRANLGPNLKILATSAVAVLIAILIANLIARRVGKTPFEKGSLIYLLAFTNNTYFGLPVVEGVFGEEVLARFIVFNMPFNVLICSYGFALFATEKRAMWKKALLSPMFVTYLVGAAIGLSGLALPPLVKDVLSAASACMSPASMLLAGVALGSFALPALLKGLRPYWVAALRLVGIPILILLVMALVGFRGEALFLTLAITALPAGLNCVIFPESMGLDASQNARYCFITTLFSLVSLPVLFAIVPSIISYP